MSALHVSADFVYGNTRLRARKSELLAAREYEALLGRDVEGILEALADTDYRRELEAALAISGDRRALHEALRHALARALAELRAFYEGRARELVDLLLSRYDLHNLLALLRGSVRGEPAEHVLANVFPLGTLGGAAGQEIARQAEPERAVDLLLTWRLPDPALAGALAAAWPEYERTEDLAALEHALSTRYALRLDDRLHAAGPDAEPLRTLVAREHDAINVLIVLRLRFALQLDELSALPPPQEGGRFLAGGTIRDEALEAALRQPTRAEAVVRLVEAARREEWRTPLERIAAGGDLPTLQRELEVRRVRWAVGRFLTGDPLGIDIPIAYTAAKENEVRNLRLLGEGAAGGVPTSALRAQLIVPWDGRWDG
jgi:V/A-type H+-transporting ATPase subunit C